MDFRRASTSTAPGHWPKPCRSRYQVREATEVTRFAIFRHSIAIVDEVASSRTAFSFEAPLRIVDVHEAVDALALTDNRNLLLPRLIADIALARVPGTGSVEESVVARR